MSVPEFIPSESFVWPPDEPSSKPSSTAPVQAPVPETESDEAEVRAAAQALEPLLRIVWTSAQRMPIDARGDRTTAVREEGARMPSKAPPASPIEKMIRAVRRLERAFRRLQEASGSDWVLTVGDPWLRYEGDEPRGPYIAVVRDGRSSYIKRDRPADRPRAPFVPGLGEGRWGYFARSELLYLPEVFGDDLHRVAGLWQICLELRRCRRLAKRIDPTDRTQAGFFALVFALLRWSWVTGPLLPVGDDCDYCASVAYPATWLDCLREWAETARRRPGAKPDPQRELIGQKLDQLHAQGVPWKDMVKPIHEEFGVFIKSRSLRKKWERWRQSTNSATD